MDIKQLKTLIEQHSDINIYNIYLYGSHVYGTNKPDSDIDCIVIGKSKNPSQNITVIVNDLKIDMTLYNMQDFASKIKQHEISCLECIFLPSTMKFETKNVKQFFILDLSILRESISAICSNSWVKCRKKLVPGPDYNVRVGLKSLWHVFRIYNFGIQIAQNATILDYSAENMKYDIILQSEPTWLKLQETWQILRNEYATKFKLLAPKNKQ